MCVRALANNSKYQDNVLACPKVVRHFRIMVRHFIIVIKILHFLVTRLSEVIGHNVLAVSEFFYTCTAKMPGKCPVSLLSRALCVGRT